VVLRVLTAGGAGVLLLDLVTLAGCSSTPPPPASATVPLAELTPGRRIIVKVGDVPVELRRAGERVVARSLLCTHQGCTVAWQEDIQQYKCPCQGAWFDIDGKVIAGPTDKPLPEFAVTVAGDTLRVREPGPS
jgi:cytochrome b6-f complex iron-sulfur subunit